MNFLQVQSVLKNNGFKEFKGKGSHRKFVAQKNGEKRVVIVPYHGRGTDINPSVLAAIIRQSGLPKKLFN